MSEPEYVVFDYDTTCSVPNCETEPTHIMLTIEDRDDIENISISFYCDPHYVDDFSKDAFRTGVFV